MRSISSAAIASSAASFTPDGRLASTRAARLAAAQVSATDVTVVAIENTGYASTK